MPEADELPLSMRPDWTGLWGGARCIFDPSLLDPRYPDMEAWGRAGVRGGLGAYLPVIRTLQDGADADTIQAALDEVAEAGGGAVLLRRGTYTLDRTLRIPSGVVLRGEHADLVKLRIVLRGFFKGYEGTTRVVMTDTTPGTHPADTVPFVTAILMDNVSGAGLEAVTVVYDPGLPRPQSLRYLEPGFDKNPTPYGRDDLFVISVGIQESADCWVQGCRIIDAGTHPLSVLRARHVTVRFCDIVGAYNTHGGQAYLNCSMSEHVLFAGLSVQDIRHLAIQNTDAAHPCRYNVVLGCDLRVDVNYHNGDSGHNLVERCRVLVPGWHWWGPFAAGVRGMHEPPGPGNLLFRVEGRRHVVGMLPRGAAACPDDGTVYAIRDSFEKEPMVRAVGAAPAGGTLYPVTPEDS